MTLLISLATGCVSTPTSRFDILDYEDATNVRRYSATFDEGYYRIDASGNLSLILRNESKEPDQPDVVQIVHIKTVWRSLPAQTIASDTQINGTITYAVLGGGVSTTYEGGGSVFFDADPIHKERITGTIERAVLQPKRQLSPTQPMFTRVELSGTFHAEKNDRRTINAANELERTFGPREPYAHDGR